MISCIKTSPLGYADDLASASNSKDKIDEVLKIVYKHSRQWRYEFNAGKSAILVYGESLHESKTTSKYRIFRLGKSQVKERNVYDHVGLKNCSKGDSTERTIEKVCKGRKALNASSGLGLKKGGLSIKACSILYWAMIVPIVTFASELWVMKDDDLRLLEEFQRYSGRRLQRFPPGTPNETSYVGLGWVRLEIYVYVKKMLFIRTITVLDDASIYRKVFNQRVTIFKNDIKKGCININDSPIFDIMRIAILMNLFDKVMNMLNRTVEYGKKEWSKVVWESAWAIEEQDWVYRKMFFRSTLFLKQVKENVSLLIWWQLADCEPKLMKHCEVMAKIVCGASNFKQDDYRFKGRVGNERFCDLCDSNTNEDARHVILQCEALSDIRGKMFNEIKMLERSNETNLINDITGIDILPIILGRRPDNVMDNVYFDMLKICARNVYDMYRIVIRNRKGIG